MSAMSAPTGLMSLSLISEPKAAQGGPAPVQPLAFGPEKHPLVQAPKPTPNGMEPSPPLIPVLPHSQPEPQPSLPCGAVSSETGGNGPAVEAEEGRGVPAEPASVELLSLAVPVVADQPVGSEPPSAPEPAPVVSATLPQSTSAHSPAPGKPALPLQAAEPSTASHQPTSASAEPTQVVPAEPLPAPAPAKEPEVAKPAEAAAPEVELPSQKSPVQAVPTPAEPAKVNFSLPAEDEAKESSQSAKAQAKHEPVLEAKEAPAPPAPASEPTPEPAASGRPPKRLKVTFSEKKSPSAAALVPLVENENSVDKRSKRKRLPTQVYQSPIPEDNLIAKISKIEKTPAAGDDKLIVFYRNEFLAVRNTEGGFYVCQAMQNVYKSSSKIRIRWLSEVENTGHYSPDFYDTTEFDCILTNLNMERVEKNKYRLPDVESQRTQSILKRAIDVENGVAPAEETTVTEEHPDGLDLSLYRNEEQLKTRKKGNKKAARKTVQAALSGKVKKGTREAPKRSKTSAEPKKANPVVSLPKKVVGRIAKVDKPVVQRIVAAKKMGRRKTAPTSSLTSNKQVQSSTSTKEPGKKKEAPRNVAVKRKSNDVPAAPAPPEKKQKSGTSKTRSGVAGGPSGAQQQQNTRARRSSRTK